MYIVRVVKLRIRAYLIILKKSQNFLRISPLKKKEISQKSQNLKQKSKYRKNRQNFVENLKKLDKIL